MDFILDLPYTKNNKIKRLHKGGTSMNEFEKDVQDKGNDFIDAMNGFTYSFLFFFVIFIIGTVIAKIMA